MPKFLVRACLVIAGNSAHSEQAVVKHYEVDAAHVEDALNFACSRLIEHCDTVSPEFVHEHWTYSIWVPFGDIDPEMWPLTEKLDAIEQSVRGLRHLFHDLIEQKHTSH